MTAGTEIGVVAGCVRQGVRLHTLIIVVNCLVGPQGGLNGQKVEVVTWAGLTVYRFRSFYRVNRVYSFRSYYLTDSVGGTQL